MKAGSKYEPLYLYLRRSGKEELVLTFSEIEKMIGTSLPPSAYSRGWWSNRGDALQASAWMEAGYHVAGIDLEKEHITFRKAKRHYVVRIKDDAIEWNSELIKGLRQHMNMTQAEFADHLGVRQQTVSDWENEVYTPTRATSKHLMLVAERAEFEYSTKR
jgi:DNA-binding transcriptional regulator YiaG